MSLIWYSNVTGAYAVSFCFFLFARFQSIYIYIYIPVACSLILVCPVLTRTSQSRAVCHRYPDLAPAPRFLAVYRPSAATTATGVPTVGGDGRLPPFSSRGRPG